MISHRHRAEENFVMLHSQLLRETERHRDTETHKDRERKTDRDKNTYIQTDRYPRDKQRYL